MHANNRNRAGKEKRGAPNSTMQRQCRARIGGRDVLASHGPEGAMASHRTNRRAQAPRVAHSVAVTGAESQRDQGPISPECARAWRPLPSHEPTRACLHGESGKSGSSAGNREMKESESKEQRKSERGGTGAARGKRDAARPCGGESGQARHARSGSEGERGKARRPKRRRRRRRPNPRRVRGSMASNGDAGRKGKEGRDEGGGRACGHAAVRAVELGRARERIRAAAKRRGKSGSGFDALLAPPPPPPPPPLRPFA